MKKTVIDVTTELVQSILEQDTMKQQGLELVDIDYKKEGSQWVLRVFVDKTGGIDIEECSLVSNRLSSLLDEKDPIPGPYILEVSSPGAERPLKSPRDFAKAIGKYVMVTTYEPVEGAKEHVGHLISCDDQEVVLSGGKGRNITIPREKIAQIRLALHF